MQLVAKGQRKTGNDGKGKKGSALPSPGMQNPTTVAAKKGAKQLMKSNGSRMY